MFPIIIFNIFHHNQSLNYISQKLSLLIISKLNISDLFTVVNFFCMICIYNNY